MLEPRSTPYDRIERSTSIDITQESPGRAIVTVPAWQVRGFQVHGVPKEFKDKSLQCRLVVDVPVDGGANVLWWSGTPSFEFEINGKRTKAGYGDPEVGLADYMITVGEVIADMIDMELDVEEMEDQRALRELETVSSPIEEMLGSEAGDLIREAARMFRERNCALPRDLAGAVFVYNCTKIFNERQE